MLTLSEQLYNGNTFNVMVTLLFMGNLFRKYALIAHMSI
jgi:hypothetical protein